MIKRSVVNDIAEEMADRVYKDSIETSQKKLKDEFPEAYNMYIEIQNMPNPKSECDIIEGIRAKLTKLSKEETCLQEN